MHYWRNWQRRSFKSDPQRVCFRCRHLKSDHRKNGQCCARESNGYWGAAKGKPFHVRERVETQPCRCFRFVPTRLERQTSYICHSARTYRMPDFDAAFGKPKRRNDNHKERIQR